MFAMNNPPVIEEMKRSAADRITHVRLPYEFVWNPDEDDPMQKRWDPDKEDQLTTQENLDAWLAVALRGLRRMQENEEEGDTPFSLPESREEHFERYQMQSDTLKGFVLSSLQNVRPKYDDGVKPYITKDEMYSAYKNYCNEHDEDIMAEGTFKDKFLEVPLNINKNYRPPKNHYDNSGRPPAYGGLAPTAEGLQYMPVDVRKRFAELYSDQLDFDFDDEDDDSNDPDSGDGGDSSADGSDGDTDDGQSASTDDESDSTDDSAGSDASRESDRGGRVTQYDEMDDGDHVQVEGTVTDVEDGPDAMDYKLELTAPQTDENDVLGVVQVCAWSSVSPPDPPSKGERVIVCAARFETDEKWGDQLHVTDESVIDVLPEDEWTQQEADDVIGTPKTVDDVSVPDEDDLDVAPTESEKTAIKSAIRGETDEDGVSVSVLYGRVNDMPNGDVQFVLSHLVEEGVVERVDEDHYRFVGGEGE